MNQWLQNAQDNGYYLDLALPFLTDLLLAALIFYIGRKLSKLIVNIARRVMSKANVDAMLVNFISSILNGLLLLVIAIAVLTQLGVNTASLVALIGAAGLAVGLSLKDSLSNFAAGVMLIVFKPFKTGDFVEAGGSMGVVEKIHIFNTIMRSPDNKELIIPNGQIYDGTITNFAARDTRRIDLVIGISYDADIRHAKTVLEDIVSQDERILKDPACTLGVMDLADSSVNLYLRPWVASSDYWNARCDLLEVIKCRFDDEGIGIPYPQMDVHVHQ